MAININFRSLPKYLRSAPGMVVVPMAQYKGVCFTQVDPEEAYVFLEGVSLPRVEENCLPVGPYPRKTVFTVSSPPAWLSTKMVMLTSVNVHRKNPVEMLFSNN
jgi:hypothetical protein